MSFANIAIPTPVRTLFTYKTGEHSSVKIGARVVVPFRKKNVIGVCFGLSEDNTSALEEKNIRPIESVFDETSVFSPSLSKLVSWISDYYCAPIGEVCKIALPTRLLNLSSPKKPRPKPLSEIDMSSQFRVDLNEEQKEILDSLVDCLQNNNHKVFLLQGITGSGKTEIYLHFFDVLKASGKQGLLLVPEIGLTPQLTARAMAHFKDRVSVYHSGLTDAQRLEQWLKIKNGEVDVVIGTRSALFCPLEKLGAVIVDEEHDSSYKQDDGVLYNARDSAVMRAHIEGIPVVLGSATPSIESLANVETGKYGHFLLHTRPGGVLLPQVEIVDVRMKPSDCHPRGCSRGSKEKNGFPLTSRGNDTTNGEIKKREFQSLSPELYDAINETLSRGEQTLLYIGRRGFASAVQCELCGDIVMCPNCDISLSLHKGINGILSCHYCDYKIKVPKTCKTCGLESLTPIGQGSERLEAEIIDFFPSARVKRFDSDTVSGSGKRKEILDEMRGGKIDILIGTQMVTKGHDFPNVTLVGVVGADVSLSLPDFRAAERTFQLLTQVAGRAGRRERRGKVIIQTRQPEHSSIMMAKDHDCIKFVKEELEHRKKLFYPPFSRLINMRFSSNSEKNAENAAEDAMNVLAAVCKKMPDGKKIEILGPAKAPISKIRGKHRWQMLIKTPSAQMVLRLLSISRPMIENRLPRGVRFVVDVDPNNLL